MASFGPKGSKSEPANSEAGSDEHFRQMRDRMNKEREAFFQDSPSSFFGRESPFFRVRFFCLTKIAQCYHPLLFLYR